MLEPKEFKCVSKSYLPLFKQQFCFKKKKKQEFRKVVLVSSHYHIEITTKLLNNQLDNHLKSSWTELL